MERASKGDAEKQLANARFFVNAVKMYLDTLKDTESKYRLREAIHSMDELSLRERTLEKVQ